MTTRIACSEVATARYTYLLPDIAYHRDKRERGFVRAIDVWGADHHGYVPRMRAAMQALGYPDDFFHVEIVQLVRVMRGGEEVRFSKRTGDFVTLRELFEETGVDAARYFFLMRRGDSQFVFDVDLATSQTEENPVFYVQMAHARMSRHLPRRGAGAAGSAPRASIWRCSTRRKSSHLLKEIAAFPACGARAPRSVRAASHHRVPGGAGAHRARVVPQVPRPGRAAGGRAARARARGATGARQRARGPRDQRAGSDVAVSLLVVGSIALDSVARRSVRRRTRPAARPCSSPPPAPCCIPCRWSAWSAATIPGRAQDARGPRRGHFRRRAVEGESFRWSGKYSYDLSSRETLETRLGVFAQFRPKLPEKFRDSRYLFLGNIDPELQLSVLDQVTHPELVACDTMNYWIQSKRDLLLELLRHIDLLMINDSEARELSGDWNIYRAAHWVLGHGPRMVVIKQGEHGALLVDRTTTFKVPAYPLQEVFDPTGAGDAFAGGFMAYLAAHRRPHASQPAPRDGLRRGDGIVRGRGVRVCRVRAT